MSLKDAFLFNLESETHLRDARHANQIYAQNNFAFTPKTKHMYHVSFIPNSEVNEKGETNTFKFQKEIGVLVKSADLPSFRASVENKQQYNRKKNVQTRVDYQDCRITFHDDNTGMTRALLEEYYRYYFEDANKAETSGAFDARDKYFSKLPNYGMNTGKEKPFFKSITIYQLARREWVAYTLVNPLLTAWDHGSVESSGTDFNENTMSVAYEAVKYTSGSVAQDTPAGFADESIGYDITPSPLGYSDTASGLRNNTGRSLISQDTGAQLNRASANINTPSRNDPTSTRGTSGVIGGLVNNALSQNNLPVPDSQNIQTLISSNSTNSRILDANTVNSFLSDPAIAAQVTPALVNSGALANVGINTYNSANASQRASYDSQIQGAIAGGSQKLTQVASNALKGLGF